MTAFRFITVEVCMAIHHDQLSRYGGSDGIRDENMLHSALEAPKFWAKYERPDLAALAACYLVHLSRNHPFVDGNKRVAAVTAMVFLDVHEVGIDPPAEGLHDLTYQASQGVVAERRVSECIRDWLVPRAK